MAGRFRRGLDTLHVSNAPVFTDPISTLFGCDTVCLNRAGNADACSDFDHAARICLVDINPDSRRSQQLYSAVKILQ